MRERLANGLTAATAVCAIVLAALAVRNQLRPARPNGSGGIQVVENWQALAREGNVLGPPGAPVRIIEFSDFQCPFCAEAHRSLRDVRSRHAARVAVVYRHYPLPGHRYARRAAVASECAAEQGVFEPYHDLLFAQQDSLGIKPWDRFAREAGVGDLDHFRECLESGRAAHRIQRDLQAVSKLGTRGTPTFIVNGRMFTGAISSAQWDDWIRSALRDL
ncbi:MAG: thioredoxin domain-containing protein [Longimicrobiaceae bacterium]